MSWRSIRLPGPESGTLTARIHRPAAARRWLVWAHGGSWRSGSSAGWHGPVSDLVLAADATVVSVDYRLVPAHRHPAALLDVIAAVDWAREQTSLPVAVGGDSAGATLAAAAALVLRDRGVRLAAQVLAYPPLDPACRAPSYRHDPAAFPPREALRAAWSAYQGVGAVRSGPPATDQVVRSARLATHQAARDVHPGGRGDPELYSTPFEAADVRGAPPAAIVVGGADPVRDDASDYAARLRRADVPVHLDELPGVGHGAFLTSPTFRRRLAAAYVRVEDDPR